MLATRRACGVACLAPPVRVSVTSPEWHFDPFPQHPRSLEPASCDSPFKDADLKISDLIVWEMHVAVLLRS